MSSVHGASISTDFWRGRRVFITGHTGFKGAWLSLWLARMGACVTGYALEPPSEPSLYRLCALEALLNASYLGDVRDAEALTRAVRTAAPEVVIHMAAQPLVRESYARPVETYAVNVMGTVNLLEAVRASGGVRALLNVTTDKCYENREWVWGYRENEPLGGYDPYSSSKACSELVTAAYRSSFFPPGEYQRHGLALATARAGNVIGGGDWAADRLIPDCLRALLAGTPVRIRNPRAIRPWQHVLEPLSGYLLLAQRLCQEGPRWGAAWNFGPADEDARPVEWIVRRICQDWGGDASYLVDSGEQPHEAHLLKLDCSRARTELGWQPRWDLSVAIDGIVSWAKGFQAGADPLELCAAQIDEFMSAGDRATE